MTVCKYCGELLNKSQYKGNYKSCPKCSENDGLEHIFYSYPATFGTTPKRASSVQPDGPQSYCVRCRGSGVGPYEDGIRCNKL